MSPLANLLSRGKEDQDPSTDVSDLPAPALTVFARVNLLPPEIAEAERFRREQIARGLVVVAAAAIVVVGVMAASSQVTEAQKQVDAADLRATKLQAEVASLAEVPQTAALLKTSQDQRTGALGQEVRWSQYLNGLGLATGKLSSQIQTMTVVQQVDTLTPGTTGPVSFTGQPGIATITYAGIAKTQKDVSYFLDGLAKQKVNVDPYFTSSAKTIDPDSKKEVVAFNVTVTVSAKAESGRYSTPGN